MDLSVEKEPRELGNNTDGKTCRRSPPFSILLSPCHLGSGGIRHSVFVAHNVSSLVIKQSQQQPLPLFCLTLFEPRCHSQASMSRSYGLISRWRIPCERVYTRALKRWKIDKSPPTETASWYKIDVRNSSRWLGGWFSPELVMDVCMYLSPF